MSENRGVDKGLLALIQSVLGTRNSSPTAAFDLPKPPPDSDDTVEPAPDDADVPAAKAATAPEPEPPQSDQDRRKTADELAGIILKALQTLDGAPKAGFEVTVYGGNPWNAMLRITPEAGPLANAGLWRARVREMAVRLRQDYDVVED